MRTLVFLANVEAQFKLLALEFLRELDQLGLGTKGTLEQVLKATADLKGMGLLGQRCPDK